MNEKITFPRLASLIADRSGRSKRFSEDFLREFFSLISERLEDGESVKVKGLGTFRLSRVEPRRSVDVTTGQPMEISGHTKVVFVSAKELADTVNSPFEAFTAIEISDNADISQLFANDDIALKDEEEETVVEASTAQEIAGPAVEEIIGAQDAEEQPVDPTPAIIEETSLSEDKEMETAIDNEPQSTLTTEEPEPILPEEEEPAEEMVEEEEYFEEAPTRKRGWGKYLLISFGAAIVALFAIIGVWYVFANDSFNRIFQKPLSYIYAAKTDTAKENEETSANVAPAVLPSATDEETDSLKNANSAVEEEPEVPTAPSDAVVYDTIGTTRYLTTMAKSHYGNYNLWPYIYEENKDFLGHPDRIRPGTPVVIPKLSKYGVDPKNKDDIEKAKKMGIEIYARYGKKI